MTAVQVAALIAAGCFGLLACAGAYVLLRIGRLLGVATQLVASCRDRADTVLDQAQTVVDRAGEQVARTESITASMHEVTASMSELSGQVSAMTGLAASLAGALSVPVTGLSALAYGVRHAVALRRPAAAVPAIAPPQVARRSAAGTAMSRQGTRARRGSRAGASR
ncbi:MAG: DUF948 domain-containing protein [Streptosporangiaceae bacterium]